MTATIGELTLPVKQDFKDINSSPVVDVVRYTRPPQKNEFPVDITEHFIVYLWRPTLTQCGLSSMVEYGHTRRETSKITHT
jgi:hypothetical protein